MKLLGILTFHSELELDCLEPQLYQFADFDHLHIFVHQNPTLFQYLPSRITSIIGSGWASGTHTIGLTHLDCPFHHKSEPDLWKTITDWVRTQPYDWVVWLAPDLYLYPPGERSLRSSLEQLDPAWDVISPVVCEYWPTPEDPEDEPDFRRRITHYRIVRIVCTVAWRISCTGPHAMIRGLHRPRHMWPSGTRVLAAWILKHYPIRDPEQAEGKMKAWQKDHIGRLRYSKYLENGRLIRDWRKDPKHLTEG